jgi:hypothetical protein
MMNHMTSDVGSTDALSRILVNHRELSEEFVTEERIKFVLDAVENVGMTKGYRMLRFLCRMCTHDLCAIKINQNRVCRLLLDERPELLLRMGFNQPDGKEEQKKKTSIAWRGRNLRKKDLKGFLHRGGGSILGEELLDRCYPVSIQAAGETRDVILRSIFETANVDMKDFMAFEGAALYVGDQVRIVKEGSVCNGKRAIIQVANWNDQPGHYQVRLEVDGSIRSYEWYHLEIVKKEIVKKSMVETNGHEWMIRRAIIRDKINLQKYFYYQLELYVSLCRDRNYLAIDKLRRSDSNIGLSYSLLLACLVTIQDVRFKNQIYSLLQVLYVLFTTILFLHSHSL